MQNKSTSINNMLPTQKSFAIGDVVVQNMNWKHIKIIFNSKHIFSSQTHLGFD